MNTGGLAAVAKRDSYDVVIVGGAIMGSATAWFLTRNPDFNGSILVVERDPGYGSSSTAHTNSCMRQQFSTNLNIHISQFAADFVKNLGTFNKKDISREELLGMMAGGEELDKLEVELKEMDRLSKN